MAFPAAIGSFNPNLTMPRNNRMVGQSPQTNEGNTNNVNGIGNTVTNNQTNAIDQSVTRTNNGTTNVYNITVNEGDTINNQAQQAPCKTGKGKGKGKAKGKGKGKAKNKAAARGGQVGQSSQANAGSPTGMMMKMMGMMMSLMQQMSQSGGGNMMAGGVPGLGMNNGMAQFRHPGFMA